MKLTLSRIISVIFAFALVFSIDSGKFIMPIAMPLGNIPFPYFFWVLVFAYHILYSKLLRIRLDVSAVSKALLFGMFFHIILLLLRLQNQDSAGLINFASNIYRLYFKFFALFAFTFATIFIAYRILRAKGYIIRSIYDWPFFGLFLYMLLSFSAQRQHKLFIFCSLVFIIAAAIIRKNDYLKIIKAEYLKSKEIILRPRVFLSVTFLGALGIRVVYLLRTMTNPNYLLTGADSGNYDTYATVYLRSGIPSVGSLNLEQTWSWLAHMGFWQYLALFYKVFNQSYFIFCFSQAILGSVACIFVYFIARRIFNESVAKIAAIFSMLNFSMIFSSIVIDTMGLNLFCTTLTILLLCRYENSQGDHKSRTLLFALVGFVAGFMIMTFLNNIMFLLLVAIWVFVLDIKKRNLKKALAHGSTIVLFSLIAVVASLYLFGIDNLKSFISVLLSKFPETNRFYSGYFHGKEFSHSSDMVSLGLGGAVEIVLYSIPVILEKGLPALKIIVKFFIKSFAELFFNQGYGGFEPVFLSRSSDYFYCLWFYAYILTAFGVILSLLKRKLYGCSVAVWLLYLYITYTAAIHILFFRAEYRYRSLMEPYLIIFGSFGLWTLYQNAKGRRRHEDIANNNGL